MQQSALICVVLSRATSACNCAILVQQAFLTGKCLFESGDTTVTSAGGLFDWTVRTRIITLSEDV